MPSATNISCQCHRRRNVKKLSQIGGLVMEDYDEVALLRYRVIAPLLDPDLKRGSRSQILKRLSQNYYEHPRTKKEIQFKGETIRHWVKRYKKDGFNGLTSKTRSDKNSVKGMPEDIAQEAINLKLENPSRTIDGIISILEKSGKVESGIIQRSTLHRLFQNRNINIRKLKPQPFLVDLKPSFPMIYGKAICYSGLNYPTPSSRESAFPPN